MKDTDDTRGQLITYLNCMQAAQHRTHGLGVRVRTEPKDQTSAYDHSGAFHRPQLEETSKRHISHVSFSAHTYYKCDKISVGHTLGRSGPYDHERYVFRK
jgi:hypothetical protein